MAKKKTGLLIALGAVLGAAAAGISYYLKYKSFNDELDKDFHDYEDEEPAEEKKDCAVPCSEAAGRTYISLDSGKHKDDPAEEDVCSEACTEAPTVTEEEPASPESEAGCTCGKEEPAAPEAAPAASGEAPAASNETQAASGQSSSSEAGKSPSAATVEVDTEVEGE